MDMKIQGSSNGKALGIGEILASNCSASATLDHNTIIRRRKARAAVFNVATDHKVMPGS